MEGEREARALSDRPDPAGGAGDRSSWVGVAPEVLSDRDRMIVREARREILENAAPWRRGPAGFLAVLAGLALLGLWPRLRRALPGGDFVSPFLGLAGVLLVGGGLFSVLAGGRNNRAAKAVVEASLRQLADPGTTHSEPTEPRDRETDLRAATLLVSHAWESDGPAPARTVEPLEVAERVGVRLPLVIAVERLLDEELGVPPLFGPEASEA